MTYILLLQSLVTKTDFDDKLKNLNQKINSTKTKHLLVENELKKLQRGYTKLFSIPANAQIF